MKVKIVFSLILLVLLSSCGSRKRHGYKKKRRSPRVTVRKPKYKTNIPKVVQKQKIKRKPVRVVPQNTRDYIDQYAAVAIREMKLYKIPASITLAQGILESGSGRSELASRSNNHFGIKCHKGWEGKRVTHDDDLIGECFRKYKHPETSYEDHSKFLVGRKRYAKLFKLRTNNYKGWAYGLKRAGYATDPRYPKKLIQIIKRYKLYKYDKGVLPKKPSTIIKTPTPTKKHTISKTGKYHRVVKGDTLYSLSRRYNLTVSEIKRLNNMSDNKLAIGQQLKIN